MPQTHLSLIKRKAHISSVAFPFFFVQTGSLSLKRASQPGRDTIQKNELSSFPLSNGFLPLCLTSHNISCYLPPSLSSRIKWYCLYTPSIYHPISHFPRLVYLPWVLGRHEGTLSFSFSPSLSSPFAFLPSLLSSNHCWLLVAIDIRGLIKPWRSCLIYAEGVWVVLGKCSKDTSHLLHYLLSYSPGSGEDPARGSFCQLLHPAACFTFCTRLRLVINAWKCCVGGDKNKRCCGIWASWRVRFGGINDSPPALSSSEFSMLSCTRKTRIQGREEESVYMRRGDRVSVNLMFYEASRSVIGFLSCALLYFEPRTQHSSEFVTQPEEGFFFFFLDWRFIERTVSVVANWQFLSMSPRPWFVATQSTAQLWMSTYLDSFFFKAWLWI